MKKDLVSVHHLAQLTEYFIRDSLYQKGQSILSDDYRKELVKNCANLAQSFYDEMQTRGWITVTPQD